MIEIFNLGEIGVTHYIEDMIKTINDEKDHFVKMGKIDDGDKNISFIAIFKNKATIGKYSAIIHQWGCNDGKSGGGNSGFERMMNFIKNNNLSFFEAKLTANDKKMIGYQQPDTLDNWEERKKIWASYIPMAYR